MLVGCDSGGLDCPLDPPSCCYNTLFGCGTFDLPDGCSCSQYSFLSARRNKLLSTTVSPGVSGLWNVNLKRTSSMCPLLQRNFRTLVRTHERKGLVSVAVPGYGKLRGRMQGKGYTASDRSTFPLTRCSAEISTKFKSTGTGVGKATAQIKYSCPTGYKCSAQYEGSMRK